MPRESSSTDPLSKKRQLALTQNMRSWHHLFIVRLLDTGLPLPIIYTLRLGQIKTKLRKTYFILFKTWITEVLYAPKTKIIVYS